MQLEHLHFKRIQQFSWQVCTLFCRQYNTQLWLQ